MANDSTADIMGIDSNNYIGGINRRIENLSFSINSVKYKKFYLAMSKK